MENLTPSDLRHAPFEPRFIKKGGVWMVLGPKRLLTLHAVCHVRAKNGESIHVIPFRYVASRTVKHRKNSYNYQIMGDETEYVLALFH